MFSSESLSSALLWSWENLFHHRAWREEMRCLDLCGSLHERRSVPAMLCDAQDGEQPADGRKQRKAEGYSHAMFSGFRPSARIAYSFAEVSALVTLASLLVSSPAFWR
jgi:hypothetical protein